MANVYLIMLVALAAVGNTINCPILPLEIGRHREKGAPFKFTTTTLPNLRNSRIA